MKTKMTMMTPKPTLQCTSRLQPNPNRVQTRNLFPKVRPLSDGMLGQYLSATFLSRSPKARRGGFTFPYLDYLTHFPLVQQAALKGLIRLIVAQAPLAKIESTRFRSVAFKNPTAELPKSDDEDDSKKKKPLTAKPTEPSTKLLRQQGRASEWRSKLSLAEQDAEAEKPGSGKVFLNPAEKKKVAFIKKEFHDAADTIHAYIVFGHPDPARSKNVPPSLDPFEAARMAVEGCDGATYMGRTLRVDRVASGEGRNAADSSNSEARRIQTGTQTDPKRSIFVGNLDFASKEEDLRVFFETLVKAERSATARVAGDDEDGEDGSQDGVEKTWVSHVRIVRDPDTQLGKGFAYVEFTVSTPAYLTFLAID